MFELIEEKNYREVMEGVVEPELAQIRREVKVPVEGGSLNVEAYTIPGAQRAVVVLHGYTESAEKVREMIWYFLHEGWSVYAYDHRGHGHSPRAVEDTSITHVDRFEDYVRDLEKLMETVVLPETKGMPLVLYAHSMGGAVGAMALMEHPGWFTRAVLTAPMIAVPTAPFPRIAGRLICAVMCAVGKAKERAFVGQPFDPERETFETSVDTSRERFEYYKAKRVKNAHLQNSSPSYSWVGESLAVTGKLLDPKNCAKITTPLLLCQAGLDTVVLLPEQAKFVSQVSGAKLRTFEQAKHEIYGSHDEIMREYVPAVLTFLSE